MSSVSAGAMPGVLAASLSCLNPIVIEELTRYGNPAGDGGYVLPASRLQKIDAVVSFGLANDWSIEKEISRMLPGVPIHAYDHTVGEAAFRQEVKSSIKDIVVGLCKLGLLRTTVTEFKTRLGTYASRKLVYRDYQQFFPAHATHYQQRIFNRHEKAVDATIDDVFGRLSGKSHLFLKMDIEGGEYRVIPRILEHANLIDLMAIEFHDTDPLRDLFLKQMREILIHFEIIHIHGNNFGGVASDGLPELLEISFLNRKFVPKPVRRRDRLPIVGLDFANDPAKADLPLVFSQ